MIALLVVANPSPASFAHAMARAARAAFAAAGCTVIFHDLYAEGFDPVLRTGEAGNVAGDDALVERHVADLVAADVIAVFHPNWWGQPPAIMTGWIDRVFRPGAAYGYPPGVDPAGVPVGLLKARRALVFNTSNTSPAREADAFGDPLDAIWRRCVFAFCGVHDVVRRSYGPIAGSTDAQRAAWLAEVADIAAAAVRNDLQA